MFPVSVRGSIRLKGVPPEAAPAAVKALEAMLDDVNAYEIATEGNDVHFKGGVFRYASNWNVILQFGSGTVSVETEPNALRVRYVLSTLQMLGTVTAMVGVLAGFALVTALRAHQPAANAIDVFVFGWSWLFGANYVLGMIRFPIWLRRELKRSLAPAAGAN